MAGAVLETGKGPSSPPEGPPSPFGDLRLGGDLLRDRRLVPALDYYPFGKLGLGKAQQLGSYCKPEARLPPPPLSPSPQPCALIWGVLCAACDSMPSAVSEPLVPLHRHLHVQQQCCQLFTHGKAVAGILKVLAGRSIAGSSPTSRANPDLC